MHVEVVRSPKRHKTVQARVVDGVLRIAIPATMSEADELRHVRDMTERMLRRQATTDIDLPALAHRLAARYALPAASEAEWSDRQQLRWGSCTPASGRIRISTRVAAFPTWVLEYVVMHELAHLAEANHSPAFWELVDRYPRAERARGYLIAKADGH